MAGIRSISMSRPFRASQTSKNSFGEDNFCYGLGISLRIFSHRHLMGPFIETKISKPSVRPMWREYWGNTSTEGAFARRGSNVHTLNMIEIIGISSGATSAHVKVEYQQTLLRCDRLENCISLASRKRQKDQISGAIS